jgi:hypothetical protein
VADDRASVEQEALGRVRIRVDRSGACGDLRVCANLSGTAYGRRQLGRQHGLGACQTNQQASTRASSAGIAVMVAATWLGAVCSDREHHLGRQHAGTDRGPAHAKRQERCQNAKANPA